MPEQNRSLQVKCPQCKQSHRYRSTQAYRCRYCNGDLTTPEIEIVGKYAVTNSPELLFMASRLMARPLPSVLIATSNGRWAVPLANYGDEEHGAATLTQFAMDLAVEVEFQTEPDGKPHLISELLNLANSWRRPGGWSHSEKGHRGMRYILGVSSEAKSREVFRLLTAHRAQDIHARPIALERAPAKSKSFVCFWLVLGQPPLSVRRRADRVWREAEVIHAPTMRERLNGGSMLDNPANLFYEVPFDNEKTAFLQNIEWGEHGCYVLLGPSNPMQIILEGTGGQPEFASLMEFGKLDLCKTTKLEKVKLADYRSLDLNVTLRFVRRADPARAHEFRVASLRAEIKAKERVLDALVQCPETAFREPLEPLHIHFAPPGQVPAELERLLIEWSDQPQDLGSLYYLKLDAKDLGNAAAPDKYVAHVVTTRKALTGHGPSDLSVRLHNYRPRKIPQSAFYLLHDWDRFNLKIFVPVCGDNIQQLELYPKLRPSELAASKLAEALSIPSEQRQDYCAVLTNDNQGLIRVTVLPVSQLDGFRPLVDTCGWNCHLDVEGNSAQPLTAVAGQVTAEFFKGVDKGLADAVGPRLQMLVANVKDEIKMRQQQVQEIKNRDGETGTALAGLRQSVANLTASIRNITSDNGEISNINTGVQSLANAVRELNTTYGQLTVAIEQATRGRKNRK